MVISLRSCTTDIKLWLLGIFGSGSGPYPGDLFRLWVLHVRRRRCPPTTTHCLWFSPSPLIFSGLVHGNGLKFHVVDFISLQRTIRKICTLCPRKIFGLWSFFFFWVLYSSFWLCFCCLLAWFYFILFLCSGKPLSLGAWNPIAVDFLWNSFALVVVDDGLVLAAQAKGLRMVEDRGLRRKDQAPRTKD